MKLVFIKGVLAGQTLEFNLSEVTIGRDDGNVLRLRTVGVSRVHAVLKRKPEGGWAVYDQNSTNGVKINGHLIQGESPIFDHDLITIAEQEFQIEELGAGIPKIDFQPIIVSNANPPGELRQAEAAPGTVSQKSSSSSREDEEKKAGDHLLEQLRSAGSSLFDRGEYAKKEEKKSGLVPEPEKPPKKNRVRQLIYIFLLIAVAAFFAAKVPKFFSGQQKSLSRESAETAVSDLAFYYEKVLYDKQNKCAFRLEVQLENNVLVCTLDDLFSQRHVRLEEKQIAEHYANELELLSHELKSADVSALTSDRSSIQPSDNNYTRLVVISGGEVTDLKYPGDALPAAYENAVGAITAFLDKFGFSTITLSREEMESRGNDHFDNARYAFENYVGDLSKLRDAFLNYRAAITCYEQFYPPHPNLKKAKQKLKEVTELRKSKLHELQQEFSRCARLNNISGMSRVCQDIMSLTGERSQAYREASRQLTSLRRLEKKGGRR